jgi:subtilase family serine protease
VAVTSRTHGEKIHALESLHKVEQGQPEANDNRVPVLTSPNYHHWLTPVQVGERFGASQRDIKGISGWLRSQGLRVDSIANGRMMIDFSGRAAQVRSMSASRWMSISMDRRVA